MKYRCLIYVGKLCGDGFAVNFDTKPVYQQKGKLLLIGNRDPTLQLYLIDFDTPTQPPHIENPTALSMDPLTSPSEAVAYYVHHMTTKSELVQYLHRASRITVTSTYIRSIELGIGIRDNKVGRLRAIISLR